MNLFTEKVIAKAGALKPWIRKVGPNRYRVTPRTDDHGKYELTVNFDGELPTVESCIDIHTKQFCRGFIFTRGGCYHSAHLLLVLCKRQSRRAA